MSFGIVQRRGGTFDVQSVADVGTVFTLRFSLAQERPAEAAEVAAEPAADEVSHGDQGCDR